MKHVDFIFKTKCICCSYTSMTLSSLKLRAFNPTEGVVRRPSAQVPLLRFLGGPKTMIRIRSIPCIYMGVSKNRGTPKWMVYNGKPY